MSGGEYGVYAEENLLPAWTQPSPGIVQPLRLPSPPRPASSSLAPDPDLVCLFCSEMFQHPEEHKQFLQHLLLDHDFVIDNVKLIANFPAYIRYWRTKFRVTSPSQHCTTMRARAAVGEGRQEERQFLFLSDSTSSEDRELRAKLQAERLEFVLAVQEEERHCQQFQRGCLFCRQEFSSSSQLLDHMAFDHNFSVGQPDNLVFVSELLDAVEAKLEALLCLYCEGVFKTRDVLKEHMRKKGHKKLNPRNTCWDRFYLVNYLEPGRGWADQEETSAQDDLPSGFDWEAERGGGQDREWADWRDEGSGAVCLFCSAAYPETEDLLHHMDAVHGFHFYKIKAELNLTFYQQIKMINYIRRCVHLNTCITCGEVFSVREALLEHMTWSSHHQPGSARDWDQPQYYFPTYENDNLLFWLEDPDPADTSLDSVVQPEEMGNPAAQSILQDELVRRSLAPATSSSKAWRRNL